MKSLSGGNSVCFSERPWAPGDWCPTSHVMLDNDLGAIPIPGPLLLLLFISKLIQYTLFIQEVKTKNPTQVC